MQLISTIQIGKNGVDENFLASLKNNFKNHQNVKIVVLKSYTRDRKKIQQLADELVDKLGKNYNHRIIGFTLVIKKWRKNVR